LKCSLAVRDKEEQKTPAVQQRERRSPCQSFADYLGGTRSPHVVAISFACGYGLEMFG
jgi:hypothetical protein